MEIADSDDRYPLAVEFSDTCVEHYTLNGKYVVCAAQTLFPYPVEIVRKAAKPFINWEHVDSKFKYLAEDSCGTAFLYKEEPFIASTSWGIQSGDAVEAYTFASYVKGTCDWKESLVKRPEN